MLIIWVGAGLKSVALIHVSHLRISARVNSTQGLISVDRHLVELFHMARATRRQEILLLRIPAALPYFSPVCASLPPSPPSAPS